jgi:hypothetical protein
MSSSSSPAAADRPDATPDSLQMCAPAIVTVAGDETAAPPPVVDHQPLNDLVATIHAPVSAERGSVLHYSVTLTNPTSTTISFDTCPSYVEVAAAGSKGTYQLNCSRAASIGPGQHEVFQMELRISADASVGPTQLSWTLALISEGGPPHDDFHDSTSLTVT